MIEALRMHSQHQMEDQAAPTWSPAAAEAPSAPLTPAEFLAHFWGLHLFGMDFCAVERLVGTRKVRVRVS